MVYIRFLTLRSILFYSLSLSMAFGGSTSKITIVALGDSLTAGYGVRKEDAYPAQLERALQKSFPETTVINAGISGATTAIAIPNLQWQLKRSFDLLILCLGANDGLRGLDLKQSEKNLSKAISLAKKKGISVLLVGMKIPDNYGDDYKKQFQALYPRLAKKHQIPLVPYLLEGVGGIKELNLPDRIHPNSQGYQKVTTHLLPFVEKLL